MNTMRGALLMFALATCVVASQATAAPLTCSRALTQALRTHGRAEAALRYALPALDGTPRTVRATLALEAPVYARLDVATTGEKLVVRSDGGEWLQPQAHQVLHFRAAQAAAPLRWWRVLLGDEVGACERRSGDGFVLTLIDSHGAPVDSARVWLDGHGMPSRLEVGDGGGGMTTYRLSNWRMLPGRGAAAFQLSLPSGYESVELP
jgi:outer membrane lipoprotein-sorting protein